ncbi:flagellar assembly protein FliH [Anaerobacillus alkalidiazotrophicus]|uniref:Flagellar assembly protein FliH n=1 Tax=Anaerobacillus alkalidiazotrophicus TaxID=472963 RepID=A0A1S2LZU8_9BACI|nr:flagellar assembly protein FliH [Anaerobacillus alkalidiazotrophicus]
MSRVIKSSFVNNTKSEKKTIGLKKVITNENDGAIVVSENQDTIRAKSAEDELEKVRLEAEKLLSDAQLEYERVQQKINEEIIESQKRAEELFKQAEEKGYNEGFQHGLHEGQRQYETAIEEAKDIVTSSRKDYFHRLEEAEPVIVQLAIKVAEKIISESLENNQEIWLSIVKDVINEVREQEHVKIYVHPQCFELTLNHKEELRLLLPNCENLSIYPDLHLEENGCTIETPYGKIDASIDSQLSEIKYALLEKLKEMGGYESS